MLGVDLRFFFGYTSFGTYTSGRRISFPKKPMFEKIDEPIRVFVDFNGRRVRPVAFLLRGRRYTLTRLNLVAESGLGPTKRYSFSVSDAGNTFTLVYNPFDLTWKLTEVRAGE
jgi:hypothetical protein